MVVSSIPLGRHFMLRSSWSMMNYFCSHFRFKIMELVSVSFTEDDATLSWCQVGICVACCLCCYGLGRLCYWALTRLATMGQKLASFLKAMWEAASQGGESSLKRVSSLPPLVKEQGSQTENQESYPCSPRSRGPSERPLQTPRRSNQGGNCRQEILLDMARRAQPVIAEVEARKMWSTRATTPTDPKLD